MNSKNKEFSRRDFLKFVGLLPFGAVSSRFQEQMNRLQTLQSDQQNVLIFVFDALSASDMNLYGFARETMPNLTRLSEKAVVYHNHYAGGNFTSPGTASLLTGTLPWTNRAFQPLGRVSKNFLDKSIFSSFSNYFKSAYTHNPWANELLLQFKNEIEDLIPIQNYVFANDAFVQAIFAGDQDIATVSWQRTIKRQTEGYAYSLFLSRLYDLYKELSEARLIGIKKDFPLGLPEITTDTYFVLDDVLGSLAQSLPQMTQPFLGYYHFFPPHAPYRPPSWAYGRFENDRLYFPEKPTNVFAQGRGEWDKSYLPVQRRIYDEFILYLDEQFGIFFDKLEETGLLENTWVVVTSDHGELFERGIEGHTTPVLYEPLIKIPLLLFEPGRKTRHDVYSLTSAIDVLPTLLHVTGQPQPNWTEGLLLPPYGNPASNDGRSIYVLEASRSRDVNAPLSTATVALRKGRYKLIYYFGYSEFWEKGENLELYDVENDPDELNNIALPETTITGEMLQELKEKLTRVDDLYRSN